MRLRPGDADDDPLENLRRVDVSAGRLAGNETLDGVQVAVYQVALPQGGMKVWVDPQQELPVRMEITSPMRDGREAVAILDNLSWNQPAPDSLFSLEVPAGYTLEQPESGPSEGALVDVLRTCAEMNHGTFPRRLDSRAVLDLVLESHPEARPYQMGTDSTPYVTHTDSSDEQARETYRTSLRGLAFVEQVSENGSWRYVGQGVRLGDATAAVCWWKAPGSASWRVVYGNLRIKDVAADEMPLRSNPPAPEPAERQSPRE